MVERRPSLSRETGNEEKIVGRKTKSFFEKIPVCVKGIVYMMAHRYTQLCIFIFNRIKILAL